MAATRQITFTFTVEDHVTAEDLYQYLGLGAGPWIGWLYGVRNEDSEATPASHGTLTAPTDGEGKWQ